MRLYSDRLDSLLNDFLAFRNEKGDWKLTMEQRLALAQVYATLELAGQVAQLRATFEHEGETNAVT
jgi:hypothetical protein